MTIEFDGENNKLGTTTSNSVTIKTNDTDAITIDTSQNVGIKNTSPSHTLDISDNTTTAKTLRVGQSSGTANANATVIIGNGGSGDAMLRFDYEGSDTDRARIGVTSSGQILRFYTAGNNERMQIDNSGKVSVGDSVPFNGGNMNGVQLHSGPPIQCSRDNTATRAQIEFKNPNGSVGTISTSGSSTAYNTSSDYRLKENVNYTFDATTRLKQLKPARFNFKTDIDTTVDGFLAHEVSSVVPEAITGEKDAMRTEEYEVTPAKLDEEGNVITEAVMGTREVPDYQGIDQSKLVPLLTASLQEALTEIDNLKARIEALENA